MNMLDAEMFINGEEKAADLKNQERKDADTTYMVNSCQGKVGGVLF